MNKDLVMGQVSIASQYLLSAIEGIDELRKIRKKINIFKWKERRTITKQIKQLEEDIDSLFRQLEIISLKVTGVH